MSLYLEHFGLQEHPFRLTPHTDFFYGGGQRADMLAAIRHALIEEEGIIQITGEVGSGKTMLCRMLMERLPPSLVSIYLPHPAPTREDLLHTLAAELGLAVPPEGRFALLLRAVQDRLISLHGEGKRVVVLIDEAHAMPRESLEEVRLLSNLETSRHKLLHLALFGQPELDALLARPDLRQLRERISQRFALLPFSREETAAYIEFRLRRAGYRGPNPFSAKAIALIAAAGAGLSRRINILADKALLAAYAAGQHAVGEAEARAAIRDAGLSLPVRPLSSVLRGWPILFIGAFVILAAIGIGWWLRGENSAPEKTGQVKAASTVTPATLPPAPLEDDRQADPTSTTNPIPSRPPTLAEKITATHRWAAEAAADRWFLQLLRGQGPAAETGIAAALARARAAGLREEALGAYRAVRGESVRYGLIYGDYASRAEALAALATLPTELRAWQPYPRLATTLKPSKEGWRLEEKE